MKLKKFLTSITALGIAITVTAASLVAGLAISEDSHVYALDTQNNLQPSDDFFTYEVGTLDNALDGLISEIDRIRKLNNNNAVVNEANIIRNQLELIQGQIQLIKSRSGYPEEQDTNVYTGYSTSSIDFDNMLAWANVLKGEIAKLKNFEPIPLTENTMEEEFKQINDASDQAIIEDVQIVEEYEDPFNSSLDNIDFDYEDDNLLKGSLPDTLTFAAASDDSVYEDEIISEVQFQNAINKAETINMNELQVLSRNKKNNKKMIYIVSAMGIVSVMSLIGILIYGSQTGVLDIEFLKSKKQKEIDALLVEEFSNT